LVGGERVLKAELLGPELVKPELVKPTELKASEIIRGFKFRQVRYVLTDGEGGYCVMGGLLKHFGAKDEDLVNGFLGTPRAIIEQVYSKIGGELNGYGGNGNGGNGNGGGGFVGELNSADNYKNWSDLVNLNNTGFDWEDLANFLAQQGL